MSIFFFTGSLWPDNGLMDRAKSRDINRAVTGADFLQLDIAEAPAGGLTSWLAARLRRAMDDGRLPVGSRLPATRTLAADLGVSRGVVTEAYARLVDDGHIAGHGRAGTVVVAASAATVATTPISGTVGTSGHGAPVPELFTDPYRPDVFETLRAAPARIDLSPGLPDLTAFPRTAWLRAERGVFNQLASSAFGYGDPRGAAPLRKTVAEWLARFRGIRVHADDVIIVGGVAQAIWLIARRLLDVGITKIGVEDPGSLGVRQHLQSQGLRTPPILVDDAGLRIDALSASGVPAVMTTPAHQFPTGVVLHGARRRELIGWAEAGGLIVEDDYDAEHRYDRPPVPALRSMDSDRIFYTGSVSKVLAPALRIGWLLVPPGHHEAVVAAKRNADLGNPVLAQLVLAEMMRSGTMERHLRSLRSRHRRRRDAMIAAIRDYLPTARVHGAAAGLHLMITFDDVVCDAELAVRALNCGVKVQPLSWHRQEPGGPGLVLGYAATPAGQATEGIKLLGRLLQQS